MVLGLSACSGSNETNQSQTEAVTKAEPSVVTVKTLNGDKKEVDLEVPFDPKRVAVMDMAALDILEQLGLEERVVGASDTSLDYLEKYMEKEQVAALGTIKEADMEAVMASEPDVIFIGGRLAKSYDALSGIAPVVYLSIDTQLGTLESVRKNAGIIASIFGLEEQADQLLEGFEERLAALAGFSTDKTAIVGMVTSGGFNVLGNDGRCSLISREADLRILELMQRLTHQLMEMKHPLSLLWKRSRIMCLYWTGMLQWEQRARSLHRRLWKMS